MADSPKIAPTDDDHLQSEVEIIDIPLLLKRTQEEDSSKNKQSIYSDWRKCCIYRVPRKLRSVNEPAYTPQVVPIGPYHHNKPNLRAMEILKSKYLDEFCKRTGKTRKDLKNYIDKECEERIRACYAGTFECIPGGFVDMIITDAGFIIELLLRSIEGNEDDYILCKPWLRNCIEHDLILLENQLPFFVLKDIFAYAEPPIPDNLFKQKADPPIPGNLFKPNGHFKGPSPFLELACHYFSKHHKFKHRITDSPYLVLEVVHFTDLLRSYFCHNMPESGENDIGSLRNVTKLDEAGVDFEPDDETTYLSTITFKQGWCMRHCPFFNCAWLFNWLPCFSYLPPCLKVQHPTLVLPHFKADDATECIFRNLMALEQCHYPDKTYVCNYVSLMDKLINTPADVEMLMDKKVIANFLGSSKAVAELFNNLCQHIVEQNSCFYGCVQEIKDHCKNPLNRIMATLKSVYFLDFWRGTATIVGIIVLGITFWSIFLRHILK